LNGLLPANLPAAFDALRGQHGARCALHYPESGREVSYAELGLLADRLAVRLLSQGLVAGDLLALFHDKSPEAYAAMLACLRLGVAYVNLDPDSPWERLRRILDTCQPRLVLNAVAGLGCADALRVWGGVQLLQLHELAAQACASPVAAGDLAALEPVPAHLPAYVMFTSGSTGAPKGAVMSQANVLSFIGWAQRRFALGPSAVLTQANPLYFDNSVFDFYAALFSGATLVPLNAQQVRDPRRLVRLVGQAGCTLWFSVPSLLVYLLTTRALAADAWPAMRQIVFGGEGFPKRRLHELHDLYAAQAQLVNVYGPTECTCICSAYDIVPEDFDDMQGLAPLGRLSENFSYELLPVEAGADGARDADSGELLLFGPQVGLGYYNDAARSARSFVQNPRHMRHADIGYRTGDLVRRDAQGLLHFRGRADFQIKHMGYRIELEEIEAALSSLGGVLECAVVYQGLGDGLGQIVAFTAVRIGTSEEALRQGLSALLPAYMLPRRLELLNQPLDKNANGKIDRIALQARLNPGSASAS
jgi:D-alanine--poly(phosphoribitol) ligase subunit 1